MLAAMLHARRHAPALLALVSTLGLATPALADVEVPKQDTPSEEGKGKKGGDCSVQDSKLELGSLAALVLLISGAALRRRRA